MDLAIHLTLIHLTLSSADGRTFLENPIMLRNRPVFIQVLHAHHMGPAFILSVRRRHDLVSVASFCPQIFISIPSFGLYLVAPFTMRSLDLHKALLNLFLTDEVSLSLLSVSNGLLNFRINIVLRFLFEVSRYYARICDGALHQEETTAQERQNISCVDEGKIEVPAEFGRKFPTFILIQVPFVPFVFDEPEVVITQLHDTRAHRHNEGANSQIPLGWHDAPALGSDHLEIAGGFPVKEILRDFCFLVHVKTGHTIFFQSLGEICTVSFFVSGRIIWCLDHIVETRANLCNRSRPRDSTTTAESAVARSLTSGNVAADAPVGLEVWNGTA